MGGQVRKRSFLPLLMLKLIILPRQARDKHRGSNVRFSRSPTNGASTIVVTDNDPAAAQRHALALAEYIWSERAEWDAPPITKEQAVLEGMPPLGDSSLSC